MLPHENSLVAGRGIRFPEQGSDPGPLHWDLSVSATGPPEKSLQHLFVPGLGSHTPSLLLRSVGWSSHRLLTFKGRGLDQGPCASLGRAAFSHFSPAPLAIV